ncbi:MAG: rubrerythrin [Clostridia bacterium]|nr:rubrerythrin [Clostridia bacterium]
MQTLYKINYTTRDRLLRAWEDAMESVRRLEVFSHETEEHEVKETFAACAELQAQTAAKLYELLRVRENG